MNPQPDLFGGDLAPTFAPHLDPSLVTGMRIRADVDRDHVGAQEIGRLGNNATVFVFEVIGAGGLVLYAEQCTTPEAAEQQMEQHAAALEAHRQRELF